MAAQNAYAPPDGTNGRFVLSETDELFAGQLRRQVTLQSEAIYRVCDWDRTHVLVEVIQAPGLAAGQRFKFSRSAVMRMEPGDEPGFGRDAR